MTSSGTSLVQYRLPTNTKLKSIIQQKYNSRRCCCRLESRKSGQINNHCCPPGDNNTMSDVFMLELDRKLQQVKECGIIAHGYHNENIQYPVHVRRSHDGEKVPSSSSSSSSSSSFVSKSNYSHRKKHCPNSTVLTPSSHENLTKLRQNELPSRTRPCNERQAVLIVPPNKTINDIVPSLKCDRLDRNRKSPSLSRHSSLKSFTSRPQSITNMSLSTADEQQINSLSDSSQALIHSPLPTKTLTQRFFSRFFHHPSKC